MKKLAFLLPLFLLFAACGEEKKQYEALEKETDALHNSAMKDVAEMNRVARQIKEFLVVATMTPEQSTAFTNALVAMGKAENDMNTWMAGLKNSDEMPVAEGIKYLESQKAFLTKNGQDIRAATEAGKKLLPKAN